MQQHQSHWEESCSSTAIPILFPDMSISLPWYPVLRCFYVIRYFITWEMHYFTIASKHAANSILTENWYPCEKERNERNNVITKWGWKYDKLFMKWLIHNILCLHGTLHRAKMEKDAGELVSNVSQFVLSFFIIQF